jgi:hypothetical protein
VERKLIGLLKSFVTFGGWHFNQINGIWWTAGNASVKLMVGEEGDIDQQVLEMRMVRIPR